jgi:hypothetical protein
MPVPDFSPGEVLTAAAMDSIGMWQVGTMTFSASNSETVDGIFSSSYRRYLLTWDLVSTAAAATNVFLQLRKAGSNAVTNYDNTFIFTVRTSASPLTAYAGAAADMTIGYAGTLLAAGFMYISRPAISGPTGFVWQGGGNGSSNGIIASGQGSHTTSDTYDGLRIFTGAGVNLTGQAKIYGLRD